MALCYAFNWAAVVVAHPLANEVIKMTLAKIKAGIIYRGPSVLDDSPIVCIATINSNNIKTGAMLQTWILADDPERDPLTINRLGLDYGICGECPLKGTPNHTKPKGTADNRPCYVTLYHAPLNIWKTLQRGRYPTINPETLADYGAGQTIRLGAYGDPAAVPHSIWDAVLTNAKGWTGYTHQFGLIGKKAREVIAAACMVSADSLADAKRHWAEGRRTFRVITGADQVAEGEIICPATKEGGQRTTCEKCKLCQGSGTKAANIAAVSHGNGRAHANRILAVAI